MLVSRVLFPKLSRNFFACHGNFYLKLSRSSKKMSREKHRLFLALSNYSYGTPPPSCATNPECYTAVFVIHIFVFFLKKTFTFRIYPSIHIMFYQKSHCFIFLQKTKVVPLGFFQILIKIHDMIPRLDLYISFDRR